MELFINNNISAAVTDNIEQDYSLTVIDNNAVAIGKEIKQFFEYVNFVTICGLVGILGISVNIINIIIFYKQGFTITVNIAFFSLAISDLCCLISVEWVSICMNPRLPFYDTTWVSLEVMYLSAAWPHVCSCRITSYITVYITAERYLSIAFPLKVKQIVTTKRTAIIICIIYIVNIMPIIPEYATSYLGWRHVPDLNTTLVGIIFSSSRPHIEGVCHVMHAVLSATSFVGVIIFTVLLIIKLRQTSEWRKRASAVQNKGDSISTRDQRTVKMIVLIASVLIVCYIPGAIISTATFIVGPQLNIKGRYIDLSEVAWSIACACQSINSSVNFFLYYRMSSKYRQTFHTIFWKTGGQPDRCKKRRMRI